MTDQIRLPDLDDDEQRTLDLLMAQLDAKLTRNLLRASYYDGKRAIRQVGTLIPPQYFRLGIVLGWSAKSVDGLSRRCNLDKFFWPDGDLDSIGYPQMRDGNHLGTKVSSGLISSLIHGTSFLVNTEGDTSKGEPAGLIHVKDAMNATGVWNERAYRLDNLLSITARDDEGRVSGLALYLDGVTIVGERDGSGKWASERSEHSWGVPAEPLVYKPRVGRPFGASRISRPVMSIHDMAIRTVIRMEGHADVYSWPEMWMLGADERIFKNADGSPKASWQIMLGRIKGIPDDEDATNPRADVKQFPASSPQPHIDQLKQQAALFAGETSLSVTELGVQAETNATTADGSDVADMRMVGEAEGAIDDWRLPLRRAVIRALAMANGTDGIPAEWATIDAKFRDARYLSRAAQADAGMKQLTAAPWLAETEVGLELLGLSEQQIVRAMAERRRIEGRAALTSLTQAAAPLRAGAEPTPVIEAVPTP